MRNTEHVGIIGFGSMGEMLAEGLLRTGTISGNQLFIYTRTRTRANRFARVNDDITICDSVASVVSGSKILLLCVPPGESIDIIREIKKTITKDQILVSIVGSLTLDLINRILPQKTVRMVPSITAEVDEGTFIVTSNIYCTERDTNKVCRLFQYMGEVLEVPESKIEVFTDLTSCSPGILSAIFQEYVNSAERIGKVSKKQAMRVFTQTLYGLAKLYYEEETDFESVIGRVARKGGTTEIGIGVIRQSIPECFDQVYSKTLEHQKKRKNDLRDLVNSRLKPL